MKTCIRCGIDKELNDFYAHPQMRDGHLNKCKECCKLIADAREKKLRKNSEEWCKNERIRSKEKYYRLNYRKRQYELNKKKTYKNGKYKNLNRNLKLSSNERIHHWNYNFIDDVIILDKAFHRFIHRFLILDEISLIFKTTENDLLDSKEKHLGYIEEIKIKFNK